jgi:hypothetical protein
MAKAGENAARQQKKAYRAPTLRTFGNVQQITHAQLKAGTKADGVSEKKTGITGGVD